MRFCLAALALWSGPGLRARLFTGCRQVMTDRLEDVLPAEPGAERPCATVLAGCRDPDRCVRPCGEGSGAVVVKNMGTSGEEQTRAAQREAQAMLALRGLAGTMQMRRCVEMPGRVLFVFEQLYKDLEEGRAEFRALSPERQSALFLSVAETLVAMHALDWTHGDLKPQNIMFVNATRSALKLIDFGLAGKEGKLGAGGTFVFMAPELSLSGYAAWQTKAMDVWMLGTTLLELLDPHVLDFLRPMAEHRFAFIYHQSMHDQLVKRVAALLTPANEDVRQRLMLWLAYLPQQRPSMAEAAADLRAWGGRIFALGDKGPAPERKRADVAHRRFFGRLFGRKHVRLPAKDDGGGKLISKLKSLLRDSFAGLNRL